MLVSPHERDADLQPDQPRQTGDYRADHIRNVMSPEINSRQRDEQNNYASNEKRKRAPTERLEAGADEDGEQTVEKNRSHGVPARESVAWQIGERIFRKRQRPMENSQECAKRASSAHGKNQQEQPMPGTLPEQKQAHRK